MTGWNLAQFCISHDLKHHELATYLGIQKRTLVRWIRCPDRPPNEKILELALEALERRLQRKYELIIKEYTAGTPVKYIAFKFDTTSSYVSAVAKRHGLSRNHESHRSSL